jgi:hypothetical protein
MIHIASNMSCSWWNCIQGLQLLLELALVLMLCKESTSNCSHSASLAVLAWSGDSADACCCKDTHKIKSLESSSVASTLFLRLGVTSSAITGSEDKSMRLNSSLEKEAKEEDRIWVESSLRCTSSFCEFCRVSWKDLQTSCEAVQSELD